MYIMSCVELVFDEAVNDRAFSYTLVSNKHNLEFDSMLPMSRVAQFLVVFATHLSNQYIINHHHYIFHISNSMDIYSFAKYQNIADRIKRLSNAPNLPIQPLDFQTSNKYRKNMLSPYQKKEKKLQESTYRLNYLQKQTSSRVPTQQTQRKPEQQSYSFINDLVYLRQNQSSRLPSRQKRPVVARINEIQRVQQDRQSQERSTVKRYAESIQQNITQKPSLSKIKSDSSLKIDEILESYNNYKLNKQTFLSSLDQSNNENHQRIISQNLKQYFEEDNTENVQPVEKRFLKNKEVFGQIDNIWNQQNKQQDKGPIFLRSKKTVTNNRFPQLFQKLGCQNLQKPEEQIKPRSFSRSKLILKNLVPKKQIQDIQPKSTLNMILSPRGLRIPGKICKNNDKSMVTLPMHQ